MLAFFAFPSLRLGSCTLAPSLYMQQQKKAKLANKQKEYKETKKVHKRANRRRIAHKDAYKQRKHTKGPTCVLSNKHVIEQKRVY